MTNSGNYSFKSTGKIIRLLTILAAVTTNTEALRLQGSKNSAHQDAAPAATSNSRWKNIKGNFVRALPCLNINLGQLNKDRGTVSLHDARDRVLPESKREILDLSTITVSIQLRDIDSVPRTLYIHVSPNLNGKKYLNAPDTVGVRKLDIIKALRQQQTPEGSLPDNLTFFDRESLRKNDDFERLGLSVDPNIRVERRETLLNGQYHYELPSLFLKSPELDRRDTIVWKNLKDRINPDDSDTSVRITSSDDPYRFRFVA